MSIPLSRLVCRKVFEDGGNLSYIRKRDRVKRKKKLYAHVAAFSCIPSGWDIDYDAASSTPLGKTDWDDPSKSIGPKVTPMESDTSWDADCDT